MSGSGLVVEVQHAAQLCYAMQQSAVPWLLRLALHNRGAVDQRDLRVAVELPGFAEPAELHVAELPAGATLELPVPDLRLHAGAFANAIERQRADLIVSVARGDAQLAREVRTIDVLAYNEWPGLALLPALLAAFVAPNHPALTPLLQAVAAHVEAATGSGALDGYQTGDAGRARALLAAVHAAIGACGVRYVSAPPSFEQRGQKIRTPEQVLGERLGTCLDLAVAYAALLEQIGLAPLLVVQKEHAFVGAWLVAGAGGKVEFGPAVELRKHVAAGRLAVLECTLACTSPPQPFARAAAAAEQRLTDDAAFVVAVDVAAARSAGIRPLPVRTSTYTPMVAPLPAIERAAPSPSVAPLPTAAPDLPPLPPPKDRLEHWKQKLLDLSLFNRLLNFVETKKTVRLCAHPPAALAERLEAGRVRVHARPQLGDPASDPRDLALASQRAGSDLLAGHLAAELRAGRLCADVDADELERRQVEIFRHARTSLEESGANTLWLALGFLRWYETPDAPKPRRAPLVLLPLTIERTSVQEGFRFVLDDAEPRLNQTLLQLLQRDFDLRTGLGDAVPECSGHVDVDAVLDAFRRAVLAVPRWEVETTACIGFFSFTKYLMWLDLQDRDELLEGPVLRHLVESPGAALPQDAPEYARDELDDLDPSEVFCPKDADSSQLAAVLAGAGGRSFVLEGPPGTGKSQTITNLIAQSLANGRRVLFVAEKRAALEVVQRRLDEVGLGPFCLELHSQKSGPKAVLEQLRRALELGQRRAPEQWQRLADELQQERTRLNELVRALHRRREHGFSVHEAMATLMRLRDAPRVPLPDLLLRPPVEVGVARAALAELVVAGGAIGVPSAAPFWGAGIREWTPAVTRDLRPLVDRLALATDALAAAQAPLSAAFGLGPAFGERGPSRAQLAALLALVRALTAPSLPPPALLTAEPWADVDAEVAAAVARGTQREAQWAPLAARWRPELLGLDVAGLAATYRLYADAFFLWRWWRLSRARQALSPVAAAALPGARRVRDDLEAALRVQEADRELARAERAAAALGSHWRGGRADWAAVDGWLATVRQVRQLVLQLVPGSLAPDRAVLAAVATCVGAAADGASAWHGQVGALLAAHDEFVAALAAVQRHLELDATLAFGGDAAPGHLAAVAARVRRWRAEDAALRDHCAWRRAASAVEGLGGAPLVAAHAAGDVATEALMDAFERALCEGWLDEVHRREPELARFRGRDHEAAIERFARLDRQLIATAGQLVAARLAAKLPQLRDTQVPTSELGILERELKKQRRHKSVRRLFAEIPGLLPRLAPCVLMSPLSVAQFLGRGGARFDLVVFDEASQIPMWDAVGAIGRGEAVIVVGDSRQLPPTSFFQRLADGDEPAPDEIPEDLESVLDECGAAGLPRMHLDWHYRSRHESLIAFSNHHYYRNRLLTFPSPVASGPGAGVRCVRVAGVYDRAGSQQNRIEAEALVGEIVRRLADPRERQRSIGVVTFSRAQQVLIEDLLDARRRSDPAFDHALASADEPLFVKNLENVQGDERDVILFSICYGPDAAGKVYENYGPLNLDGGERRLNVAVTRARRELLVFTSVGPEQVANRSAALGARHLRAFLDYAERGQAALAAAVERDPSRDVESPFEAAVRDALVQRGHEVHTQVGCSGYRIDLAVVDPTAPGRYLLGVECDGRSYHSAATARDRDRLRAAVLQGLGWRLCRVWSTDFWQDPAGAIARVEEAIRAARAAVAAEAAERPPEVPPVEAPAVELAPPDAPPDAPTAAPTAAPPGSEPPPPDADGPHPYGVADLPAGDVPDAELAAALLTAEAPIAFDRLARTLAAHWGLGRVTDRVRDRVRAALPAGAFEQDGFVWGDADQPRAVRGFRVPGDDGRGERDADELPPIEVEHAMAWLLRQHEALAADDLARETARCFGIQRLGNVVRDVMERGLERLLAAGRCARDGELVRRVERP